MTPKMRTLWGYLICVLGFATLLHVAFTPHLFVNNEDASREPAKHPKNRSSIRLSEKTMQLKPVHSGEISSGFVFVENVGNSVITDADVKVSCTCSDVKLSDTTINPRASIKIDFSIDTKGKYEEFVERFLFTYSDEEQNRFDSFYVTVPILAPGKIVAQPPSLQFNGANVGETFSSVAKLLAKDLPENETVDIIDVAVPDWMSVELEKKNASWQLTLSGIFPNQSGRYVEFVRIKSSSERYSEMIIPIIVEYATIGTGRQ